MKYPVTVYGDTLLRKKAKKIEKDNKDLKQNLEFIADKVTANNTECKKSYQYTLLKTRFKLSLLSYSSLG